MLSSSAWRIASSNCSSADSEVAEEEVVVVVAGALPADGRRSGELAGLVAAEDEDEGTAGRGGGGWRRAESGW
jgi:hypothetical protein